ncbi:hypothetical protein PMAYCL1PPCAC_29859, partial [Pristionchus mayeri]
LILSSLLVTQAIDLGDFNYTEFVENIKKTGEFLSIDQREMALLKEGGHLKPTGEGVLHLADNQTAFVLQGKLGDHNLTFTNTSLELNSVGNW